MNVAEWSLLLGQPVGCSVFWIDQGIDTGPVVATAVVDIAGCETVARVRERVNDAQLALLDDVLREIAEHGRAPAPAKQLRDDGRQYFRMHPDLLQVVERRLTQDRQVPV
jgi:folate-dependent phosphoribosylglycinamide formyltransferase PurN